MEWRKVEGFNGYYVSDTGLVKTDHYVGTNMERLLRFTDRRGYYLCYLSKGGKHYSKGVARLVAEAFIENPDNKRTVNHKNGDRHDNRVENLEWTTDSENCKHRFTHLKQVATYHGKMEKPVVRITELGEEKFESLKEAHKKTGTRIGSIRDVCNGKQATAGGCKWKRFIKPQQNEIGAIEEGGDLR